MDRPMSNLHFELMCFGFRFRDLFLPPRKKLNEVGIRRGFYVLDYGCGPGSYSIAAAELVGNSGKVYALDIHPLALQMVQKAASRRGLGNIETICSDHPTGLEDNTIDVVLLYDTYHELSDPDIVLEKLHRIIKPDSILSFSDHHMKEDEILSEITKTNLFALSTKAKMSYLFSKA